MNQDILDFIKSQRVCVLAVEMLDGSPHAATVHFAYSENPSMFFFETGTASRKSEPLLERKLTRATLVIGFDESNMRTLQFDGNIRLIEDQEKDIYDKIYFGKFPEKKAKAADFLLLAFVPTWWRFTDWTRPAGKVILTSEDEK